MKIFRVYALSGPLKGLLALGLGIAGGTGNGLVSGLRPVYHFFQMMRMRALEPVPATRLNLDQSLKRAGELGEQIAGMANERTPFIGLEEQLVAYDTLHQTTLSTNSSMDWQPQVLCINKDTLHPVMYWNLTWHSGHFILPTFGSRTLEQKGHR